LVKRVEINNHEVRIVYRINPGPDPPVPRGEVLQHCPARLCALAMKSRRRRFQGKARLPVKEVVLQETRNDRNLTADGADKTDKKFLIRVYPCNPR
jgi:hypothetical protein